jgi:acyl-CoA thioesterase-2
LSLFDALKLERIEVNLFRGRSVDPSVRRIFGGQVIAQALLASYETVETRLCHSLHCYFIRPGDPGIPILFNVDRARDGGSFTTRRVTAIQHGQQIFNLSASFQDPEAGLEHQAPMPVVKTPDEALRPRSDPARPPRKPRPVEIRGLDTFGVRGDIAPRPGTAELWMRANDAIDDDPRAHQVALAYASDLDLLPVTTRPHGVDWRLPNFQPASLDHAMWFHRPVRFSDWHLFSMDSPSASGGRGFVRGQVFSEDGRLVASVAQEGLIRMRAPRVP